jgi:hypothetical protein
MKTLNGNSLKLPEAHRMESGMLGQENESNPS